MSAGILPLELRDIRCRFGRKAVLRGVGFEVRAGEVVGLVGANGAGKTTLFSIMVGLRQPDSGARLFAGERCDEVGLEQRARLAWLAHNPQLYPLLTARENIELFVDLAGSMRPSDAPSPEVLLTKLGLAEVIDRPVQTFSRGMAQRVALARALALRPQLLILDEPFTALDRSGRALLGIMLRAEAERGAAVLLSSHDVDVVAKVADRVMLLQAGVIHDQVYREARDGEDGELDFRDRIAALG